MSSDQGRASEQALATNRTLAQQYYALALPGLQSRNDAINQLLASGGGTAMPSFLQDAFSAQRGGIISGLTGNTQARAGELAAQGFGERSGNVGAALSGTDFGKVLAGALTSSRTSQATAGLENILNLTGMGMGSAGQAGNASLGAAGNQLQVISMLPKYNPTLAAAAGIGSAAYGIYGALGQQDGQPTASPYAGAFGASYPATGSMWGWGAPQQYSLAGLGTAGSVFGR